MLESVGDSVIDTEVSFALTMLVACNGSIWLKNELVK